MRLCREAALAIHNRIDRNRKPPIQAVFLRVLSYELVTKDPFVLCLACIPGHDEAFAIFPAELVFTIPHFARSTAVLAHLHELSTEQLEDLLDIAWRSKLR